MMKRQHSRAVIKKHKRLHKQSQLNPKAHMAKRAALIDVLMNSKLPRFNIKIGLLRS